MGGVKYCIPKVCNQIKYNRLGLKLGFSIGADSFGYGLVIPHHGTIVVGGSNKIGNYAVLHTSTCITAIARTIGDGLYLSTGAKLTTKDDIGNGVTIATNSVVTKGCPGGYALLAGMPAEKKADRKIWYEQENGGYLNRVIKIEKLRKTMKI